MIVASRKLGAVLKAASVAQTKAKEWRYTGVEVFIKAPNITRATMAERGRVRWVQIPRQGVVSASTS